MLVKHEKLFLSRLSGVKEDVSDCVVWAKKNMHPADYIKLDTILYTILMKLKSDDRKNLVFYLSELLVENQSETVLDQLLSLYDIAEKKKLGLQLGAVNELMRNAILKSYEKEERTEV